MNSSEDLFDVVDHADQVIDQQPRSVVHAKGLLHRAIHIWIFNSEGLLFLQKRSMSKDLHPGVWDSSVSGHVDSGEDYDTAAQRELFEEIQPKDPIILKPLFKTNAVRQTGNEFVWIYQGQSNGPFQLNPHEIDEGNWFSKNELNSLLNTKPQIFSPCFRYLWNLHT